MALSFFKQQQSPRPDDPVKSLADALAGVEQQLRVTSETRRRHDARGNLAKARDVRIEENLLLDRWARLRDALVLHTHESD